jgi:hypothetical protein
MKAFVVSSFLALVLSTPAHAVDLSSPFGLETTKVLPKGIGNPRFIDITTGVDTKFNGLGLSEPLGAPLFKVVTWDQVMQTQVDDAKRATIQGVIQANGLQGLSPGNTTGSVSTFANVKVPALAYGITDRFTLAVAVPIVNVDVNASTGFNANGVGVAFVNAAADNSPALGAEASQKLNDSVNQKLVWAGMNPIHSFTVSGVGDLQVVGKYLLGDDQVNSYAVKETFIVPTGIQPNPDNALDVPTGDGRFGLATQFIYNRALAYGLTLSAQGSYTAYMPHNPTMRLPSSGDDPISQDKEELHENFRSLLGTSIGLEEKVEQYGLLFGTGYSLQYLSKVSYNPGVMATGDRLVWLENEYPSETLHSLLVSAGFSTVDWYKAKKFVYPFEVKLAFAHPFAGRNATTNDLLAAELVLFF